MNLSASQTIERGRSAVQKGRSAVQPLVQTLKPWVRDGLAFGLSRSGLTNPQRFAKGRLTVVTFHRVLPEALLRQYPLPGLAVTPEQMSEIVEELKKHFRCLPLIEAYREAQTTPAVAGKPLLAITLDDGALDNFQHAAAVLKQQGVRASFYIPVDSIDRAQVPWHDVLGFALMEAGAAMRMGEGESLWAHLQPFSVERARWEGAGTPQARQQLCQLAVERAKAMSPEVRESCVAALRSAVGSPEIPDWAGVMSWQQVKQLSEWGHEIGSHTLTHPLLPDCDEEQIGRELQQSRERLQQVTGAEVASFCYPNGSYDLRCVAQAMAAGYECSVTTKWGLNDPSTPPHELKRCDMDFQRVQSRVGDFSSERLLFRLSGLQPGLR